MITLPLPQLLVHRFLAYLHCGQKTYPNFFNPFKIVNLTYLFVQSDFTPFQGKAVRTITVPSVATQPRSFLKI